MNLKHHFLLAMPGLTGDYFADSLTYICEHNAEGAMGIMINRPSDISLLELFAQIGLKSHKRWVEVPVLEGGPVATDRGFVLHSAEKRYESSTDLSETLVMSTAMEVLDAISQDRGPDKFMVALGYAGWGAGQLEQEIADNVWLTTQAQDTVMFDSSPDDKLQHAASALGVDMRLIAARPGHA